MLSSNVWLQTGTFTVSIDGGSLRAAGDQVSYVTKTGTVFEADRSEITAEWPWHGGGVNLTVDGETYKLSFVRPKGGREFDKSDAENRSEAKRGLSLALVGSLVSSWADAFDVVVETKDAWKGRGITRQWKAYFGQLSASARKPGHTDDRAVVRWARVTRWGGT